MPTTTGEIQLRRDTAANWTSANPTLGLGEFGYETDTGRLKLGDGSTAWSSLRIWTPPAPTALTDAATITVNALANSSFRVTLGGNRTLGNPTGARDGQMIVFELAQDGTGSRTITLDTKYKFGSDLTSVVLSTAANTVDILGVRYNASQDKFWVVSFVRGF